MNNVEENIAKLQKLYETGVISQEELAIKKAELLSEPSEEELSEMNELLEKGLISEEEFEALKNKKKKEAVAAAVPATVSPISSAVINTENATSKSFIGKNLMFLIIIAVLIVALGFVGFQLSSKQSTIDSLKSQLEEEKSASEQYEKQADNYGALLTVYMDDAVFCAEGDGHYHRLVCPVAKKAKGNVYLYYVKDAKDKGYTECSTCFGKGALECVEEYF